MALYSSMTGLDYCLYDSKEGRDYVQGYAVQIFVGASQKDMVDVRQMLEDKQSNPYGYIVTEYPVQEQVPCRIVFILYKSLMEACLGVAVGKSKRNWGIKLPFLFSKEPVWFHKGWVLKTYDPKLYAKDEDKYAAIRRNSQIQIQLPKEEVKKWRKEWIKKNYNCYAPRSKEDDICRNANPSERSTCKFCPVSTWAGRYEGKKCIKRKYPVPAEKKE